MFRCGALNTDAARLMAGLGVNIDHVATIRQTRRASTSSIQRRLRIGYTRAARLIDILEEKGMVGPPRGAEAREILFDLDGFGTRNAGEDEAENPQA